MNSLCQISKGNQVNIPEPGCGLGGCYSSLRKAATQVNSENGGKSPGKRFLFFLTLTKQADPGIRLTGDRVCWAEKQHDFLCCPVHC